MHVTKIQLHDHPLLRERLGDRFSPCEVELFPGPNLVIGENGSGKSTLISAIRSVCFYDKNLRGSWSSRFKNAATVTWSDGTEVSSFAKGQPAWFYDGVTDDRAMSPALDYGNISLQLSAMGSSHGQGLATQLLHTIDQAVKNGPGLLCLDEVDGTLDFNTVAALVNLERLAGVQSLVVSHHPLFLRHALEEKWRIMETTQQYALSICLNMGWGNLTKYAHGAECLPWTGGRAPSRKPITVKTVR